MDTDLIFQEAAVSIMSASSSTLQHKLFEDIQDVELSKDTTDCGNTDAAFEQHKVTEDSPNRESENEEDDEDANVNLTPNPTRAVESPNEYNSSEDESSDESENDEDDCEYVGATHFISLVSSDDEDDSNVSAMLLMRENTADYQAPVLEPFLVANIELSDDEDFVGNTQDSALNKLVEYTKSVSPEKSDSDQKVNKYKKKVVQPECDNLEAQKREQKSKEDEKQQTTEKIVEKIMPHKEQKTESSKSIDRVPNPAKNEVAVVENNDQVNSGIDVAVNQAEVRIFEDAPELEVKEQTEKILWSATKPTLKPNLEQFTFADLQKGFEDREKNEDHVKVLWSQNSQLKSNQKEKTNSMELNNEIDSSARCQVSPIATECSTKQSLAEPEVTTQSATSEVLGAMEAGVPEGKTSLSNESDSTETSSDDSNDSSSSDSDSESDDSSDEKSELESGELTDEDESDEETKSKAEDDEPSIKKAKLDT